MLQVRWGGNLTTQREITLSWRSPSPSVRSARDLVKHWPAPSAHSSRYLSWCRSCTCLGGRDASYIPPEGREHRHLQRKSRRRFRPARRMGRLRPGGTLLDCAVSFGQWLPYGGRRDAPIVVLDLGVESEGAYELNIVSILVIDEGRWLDERCCQRYRGVNRGQHGFPSRPLRPQSFAAHR